MSRQKIKAYILVTIQFGCVAIILLSGPYKADHIVTMAIEIAGGWLALWAIVTMKLRNLSASPELKKDAILVTKGPYKLIRHPMYTSIFMALIPLVIDYFSWPRLAVILILCVNQYIKMNFEERLLLERFTKYEAYSKRTKKLIPFIY